jgi:peptidyl-prolyl cis-trans isomerase SurA
MLLLSTFFKKSNKLHTFMIRKAILSAFVFLSLLSFGQQADKSAVIFTVSGEPVTVGEFEYVYTKNNINNQADYSEKSLTDYLTLYENFRLKVKEAEAMHLDTITSLKTELEGYRKQLAKSYLTDKEITDKLIQEAYDRSKEEVNVSHILIGCDENANPADTLAAYKKALEFRARLEKGEDFAKLAREAADKYKGDPSAKDNGGKIGWFTVFQTVYPFESAAYSMKPGQISMPVRTQFGYHILKLNDKRPAQGEIHVAHILIKSTDKSTDAEKAAAKAKIDSIYTQLTQGKLTWDNAVTAFSEDRTSKSKKGELQWFGVGRMMPEFEEAAYSLKKDGDISRPIKTSYGWHIIKRLEKRDIPPFSEVKNDFKKKVERDSRSSVAKNKLIDRIKKENNFSEDAANRKAFFHAIDSAHIRSGFRRDSVKFVKDATLFTLAGTKYTTSELADYMQKVAKKRTDKNKDGLLNEYYEGFVDQKCLDYEESQLDKKKPEFANLMKEYRDGILLFELTDRQVWGKATKDTIGLQAFYEANKTRYMWKDRAEVEIYNCSDLKIAEEAHKMAEKNKPAEEIQKKLNKEGSRSKVSVISGKYEKGAYDVVDKTDWKKGVTAVNKLNDSSYQFVFVKEIVQPEPKSLKEAKGYVVSDYQEYLEKKWLADLRNKYPIVVNQQVFKSLIKK